jgi:hypothetical protein
LLRYHLIKVGRGRSVARLLLAIALFAFLLETHTVPAFHLGCAFALLLIFECILKTASERRASIKSCAAIVAFLAGCLLVVWFDPTIRTVVRISQHNGELFLRGPALLFVCAAVAVCVSLAIAWRRFTRKELLTDADFVTNAAAAAAVGLVASQYIALSFFDIGSAYAVKKHFFLMVTLSILAVSNAIGSILPKKVLHPVFAMLVAVALVVLVQSGPKTSIYPIVHDIAYAERAADFPEFKPGNTFVTASTINPILKYLISISAFKSGLDNPKSIGLLTASFNAHQDAEFVMVNRSPGLLEKCAERYAETAQFVIVRPSCLTMMPGDGVLSFQSGGNGADYLADGWFQAEAWGTWEQGGNGRLKIDVPKSMRGKELAMDISVSLFLTARNPALDVDIVVNGNAVAALSLAEANSERTIVIPSRLTEFETLIVGFNSKNAMSPLAAGLGGDVRVLGIGLRTLRFRINRS